MANSVAINEVAIGPSKPARKVLQKAMCNRSPFRYLCEGSGEKDIANSCIQQASVGEKSRYLEKHYISDQCHSINKIAIDKYHLGAQRLSE